MRAVTIGVRIHKNRADDMENGKVLDRKTANGKWAVILTGGVCDTAALLRNVGLPHDPLVIAADSGYLKASPLGLSPHILVGDFDSIPAEAMPREGEVPEIITAPAEKDETDTMLACEIAIGRGCGNILIAGGFGGRLDHELSNIFWLENLKDRGVDAAMTDGYGCIRILRDETAEIPKHDGYFSVFALETCTATLSGCKYPLNRAVLRRNLPYAVSNEITAEKARIGIEGTALLCDVYER